MAPGTTVAVERPPETHSAAALGHTVAQVVLDSPLPQLDHLFDYRVPDPLAGEVRPGVRVRVPLRVAGRSADGFIVATAADSRVPGRLSEVERVVSPVPVLTAPVWRLTRAVADRAAGSASDVLRIAVPKRQARVEQAWLAAGRDPGPGLPVQAPPAGIVADLLGGARLAEEAPPGLVASSAGEVAGWAARLAGIAEGVVFAGASVVLAVPDRRDLDQLDALLAAGPAAASVLRLDAGRTPAARYRAHLAALGTHPRILLGNRSAVYAPAERLGAVLVWDEADAFHREPLAPGASTRDVALLRQEQSGCGVLFAAHARSSAVQRLVAVGWLRALPAPRPIPNVILTPDDVPGRRIPSAAFRDVQRGVLAGPVLVQVARPGDAALTALRTGADPVPIDAGRTAHELGRAFPGVKVVLADGDHVLDTIDAEPALVIATRGAEPRAAGGYRAVLLLDGRRMLARESLWVAEDCLRWWANAAALAAPHAPVHLVGVTGDVATALATWRSADFAARQLADRRILRFPPAVRLAAVSGARPLADALVAELGAAGASEVGRADDPDGVRVVVRFDYAAGGDIAGITRAALIRAATTRRPGRPAGRSAIRPAPTLRVRLDVPEPFPA